ncbi:MAG: hypothetical protein D6778_04465, partial [Nitrospirae bacterium]
VTTNGQFLEPHALDNATVIIYEYDPSDNLTRQKVFRTDTNGIVRYDKNGQEFPLYSWLRDGYTYRLALQGEYQGQPYYIGPAFKKEFFDNVSTPGQRQCWDEALQVVSCDSADKVIEVEVLQDGTILLKAPLDPSGYVYDLMTGQRIDGACVSFYRCADESCTTYSLVQDSLLGFYPDGVTPQENPQVSGPSDRAGNNVGKQPGEFQFLFTNFTQSLVGWYFIEVDFDCGYPGSDPTLSDRYFPVRLRADEVWQPAPGRAYTGQRFYIDQTFPGALAIPVPLLPSDLRSLEVKKEASPSERASGARSPTVFRGRQLAHFLGVSLQPSPVPTEYDMPTPVFRLAGKIGPE